MIEPPRFVIAYWLLPAAPACEFFRETVRRLAAQCDAPLFEPHLTLGLGHDSGGEADRTLARITLRPVELRVAGVAFTSKFTKTLFVRFDSSRPLLKLRDSLGVERDKTFEPHLSLLYKKLPKARQARLAADIQLPFATVTFDIVAATRCRLPVATAADVAVWKSVVTRRLDE